MKMKQILLLISIVAMFLASSTISLAQRRTSRRASTTTESQLTGEQAAERFWRKYVVLCNGSNYVRFNGQTIIQLNGFHVRTRYSPLSEADRLNGIQARGVTWYKTRAFRFYRESEWREWQDGSALPTVLANNSLSFSKVRGQWNFDTGGYFGQLSNTLNCSDLPWVNSARKRGTPTNTVQIDDGHIQRIERFIFFGSTNVWGGTNEVRTSFSQSNTTFINWRIDYDNVAYGYMLPPFESYWYRDGQQIAYNPNTPRQYGSISGSLGWDEPGHWQVGSYTVKVYLRKQLIAVGNFEIIPGGEIRSELLFDGFYYPTSPGNYWFLKFFENGTVAEGVNPPRTDETESHLFRRQWDCFTRYVPSNGMMAIFCDKGTDLGIGTYVKQGSHIEFTTNGVFGRERNCTINYKGEISGYSIKLNWESCVGGKGYTEFVFKKNGSW
jgi:hypothetical protein